MRSKIITHFHSKCIYWIYGWCNWLPRMPLLLQYTRAAAQQLRYHSTTYELALREFFYHCFDCLLHKIYNKVTIRIIIQGIGTSSLVNLSIIIFGGYLDETAELHWRGFESDGDYDGNGGNVSNSDSGYKSTDSGGDGDGNSDDNSGNNDGGHMSINSGESQDHGSDSNSGA